MPKGLAAVTEGRRRSLVRLSLSLILAGCSAWPGIARTPTPSLPPATPTATPEPLAAQVNGEAIRLAEYLAEVERFEADHAALGTDLATLGDYRTQILQSLIDQKLLAQAARTAGMDLSDSEVDARLEELAADAGGNEELGAWLAAHGYTVESFRSALIEEMLVQAMVEQISEQVGDSADQVHARHILVSSRQQAESLREEILAGEDFALLARQFTLDLTTRPAGGDLGWFPVGVLTAPQVEEAAFALPPGQLSPVVESSFGFHVIETIERGDHPLSPDSAVRLRQLAVQSWLSAERETAAIEIYGGP